MTNQRTTAVFYTCGICNLKCRYCGIDKSPILLEIDKALEESFKGDYYFNCLKKYFPERWSLQNIETWGGEPFIHMDRIYPLLHQVIDYYPNFVKMFSSTNFSYPEWNEQFFGLMEQFAKYPYRNFTYDLQLSCDGPSYINDSSRGIGVTEKCINNFNTMVERIKDSFPSNVTLTIGTKGTLDNTSIELLCDKKKIIEYYQFLEDTFISKIEALNFSNILMFPSVPNTAVPSPVTKKDGIIFRDFCKLCNEIEKENHFKYYKIITPFANGVGHIEPSLNINCGTCGSGTSLIGFLPNNMISICHEGFTQFVEQYKQIAQNSNRIETSTITFDKFLNEQKANLCVDEEGYRKHELKMQSYFKQGKQASIGLIANEILMLALCGQIDEKYKNQQEAVSAALFMTSHTSYCIKDNYNITGSISIPPVGLFKLLLNGAREYIEGDAQYA